MSCALIYLHLPFLAVWVRQTEGPCFDAGLWFFGYPGFVTEPINSTTPVAFSRIAKKNGRSTFITLLVYFAETLVLNLTEA